MDATEPKQGPTHEQIAEMFKTIVDPELYIDIWTLGLIYDTQVENDVLKVKMTFTSPACPAGPELVEEVRQKAMTLPGIQSADVEIVFQPPWQPSEDLKLMLGLM